MSTHNIGFGSSRKMIALECCDVVLSFSGSRSGNIHHHDVRVSQHHVGTLAGHTQEVCGLEWSSDGRLLASGGNDNLLNVWSVNSTQSQEGGNEPLFTFSQHLAAVKVS